MITSNSSPLIMLAKINKLKLLKELYKKIYIPKDVYNEVVIKGKEEKYNDAFIIEKELENFIIMKEIKKEYLEETNKLKTTIGKGESEAIMLATQEKAKLLLIDDMESRKIAESKGIECRSTPGIVLEAFKKGLIQREEYKKDILKLAEYAWLSGDIVAYFLEQGYRLKGGKNETE